MNKIKVLVVEHILAVKNFVRDTISDHFKEMEITIAENGENAQVLLEKEPFDLIIASLEIPVVKGDELLAWVRNHPDINSIPFLLMSVNIEKQFIESLFKKGLNGYLIKPFEKNDLIQKVIALTKQFDRRRSDRIPVVGSVYIEFKSHTIKGAIKNISKGGLAGLFHREENLPCILQDVNIFMEVEKNLKLIGINGTVVRLQAYVMSENPEKIEIAIMFQHVKESKQKEINSFIAQLKS